MRTGRRATLTDVATRAGVSPTTASYILNGRGAEMRISGVTEDRVRAAAADLDYRPNPSARNLRTRRTATVGLISDRIASEHYGSGMLTGAGSAARELNHLLVMGESGGDPDLERMLIEEMLGRDVDGVVYATSTTRRVRLPEPLLAARTVLLNCVDPDAETPAVVPDDTAGGRAAVAELADAGLRDIHVVGEDPSPYATGGRQRLAGIEAEAAERGLRLGGVVACPWAVDEAFAAVSAWLEAGGRAEGLICLNDRIGLGVYEALAGFGMSVPADVSIVSFDGSDLAGWLRPPLTSVALPFHELGAAAVRILLAPDRPGPRVLALPLSVRRGGSVREADARAGLTGPG